MSGVNIDWRLGVMPNVGGNALAAFDKGREMARQARQDQDARGLRKALTTYAGNPDDKGAYATIMAQKPELAIKLSEDANNRAFSSALGQYLQPNQNALAAIPPASALQPAQNALLTAGMPQQPSKWASPAPAAPSSTNVAPPRPTMGAVGAPAAEPATVQGQPGRADLSILGQPQNGRDRAFLAMVQRDPVKALKIQSTLRDSFVGRLKGEHDFYALAVDELSRVQDDAGWQAALQRLEPYSAALGTNLRDKVPGSYPGPDGIEELMRKAVPIKERLSLLMQQGNIDADNERADRNTDSMIADREADNARQDRNTSSLISNRSGRLTETRTNNQRRDTTTRRGQDRRGRETIVSVRTPEEAMKLAPGTKFRTPDGRVKVR